MVKKKKTLLADICSVVVAAILRFVCCVVVAPGSWAENEALLAVFI